MSKDSNEASETSKVGGHHQVTAYLDSSVLIAASDAEDSQFRTLLMGSLEHGCFRYPFSAGHISEMTSDDVARNATRLKLLSEVSRNLYLAVTPFGTEFRFESPEAVFETINEVMIQPPLAKQFGLAIPHSAHKQAQAAMGFDPNELNNLSPEDVISQINSVLSNSTVPDSGTGNLNHIKSIDDYLRYGERIIEQHFSDLWTRLGASPETLRLTPHSSASAVFSFLDSFGYWMDKRPQHDKGSGFGDFQHVYCASFCDVLVSSDKRFRMKATVAFSYARLPVEVVSLENFSAGLIKGSQGGYTAV